MAEQTTTVHGKPAVKIVRGEYRGTLGRIVKIHHLPHNCQENTIETRYGYVRVSSSDWVYVK
jgi:hypothetical protein